MTLSPFHFRWKDLLSSSGSLYFTFAVALCVDQVLLGPLATISIFDTVECLFPHFQKMGTMLLENGFFGWYPYVCGGVPSFVGQHPPYSLLSPLASCLPLWMLSLLLNLFRAVVSGYGMYRFLADFMGTDKRVAILGGMFFCIAWQFNLVLFVMSYSLPMICVWTLELARSDLTRQGRWSRTIGILLISFISFPVLALPYTPVLHLLVAVLFRRGDSFFRRHVALIFLIWSAYVLLFVPSITSLFEYIPFAQRLYGVSYDGFETALLQLGKLFLAAIINNEYLPLIALTLPCLVSTKRLRMVLALMLAPLIISCVFNPTTQILHFLQNAFILKLDLSNARIYNVTVMSIGLFLALDELRKTNTFPKSIWCLLAVALACAPGRAADILSRLLLLGAYLSCLGLLLPTPKGLRLYGRLSTGVKWTMFVFCLASWTMMSRQAFMLGTQSVPYSKVFGNHPELIAIAEQQKDAPFRVACIDVHPFVALGNGLDTFGQKGVLFNKNYKLYAKAVVLPQLRKYDQEEWYTNFWHYIYFSRTADLIPYMDSVTITPSQARTMTDYNIPLLLAMNVRYIISTTPVEGIENYSDQHILSKGRSLPIAPLGSRIDRDYSLPLYIYRLTNSFERGYLARKSILLDSDELIYAALTTQTLVGMRDTVYFNRQAPDFPKGLPLSTSNVQDDQAALPGNVSLVLSSPDLMVFEGTISEPCFLVISNNYHPNWSARVNGAITPMLRANITFQAVPLTSPGPVHVEVAFKYPIIWWSHVATGLGILLFFSLAVTGKSIISAPRPAASRGFVPVPYWHAITGGVLATAVWVVTFYIFVYTRDGGRTTRPLVYLLFSTPMISLALGIFCARLRYLFSSLVAVQNGKGSAQTSV